MRRRSFFRVRWKANRLGSTQGCSSIRAHVKGYWFDLRSIARAETGDEIRGNNGRSSSMIYLDSPAGLRAIDANAVRRAKRTRNPPFALAGVPAAHFRSTVLS